jgi:ComF family protein
LIINALSIHFLLLILLVISKIPKIGKRTMKNYLSRWGHDLINLFFPPLCHACELPLQYGEAHICLDCQLHLPQTNFTNDFKNGVTEKFEGRIPLVTGTALFYFTKISRTQQLIHHIKYKDKQEAATYLGQVLGEKLAQSPHYQGIDMIVPVPMHTRKQQLRGYNQAELFANGLNDILRIKVETKTLIKTKMTETQTRKSRLQRLQNTEDVYEITTPSVFEGKNVLLVDDVLTTGATFEACALAILEKTKQVNISIAAIACAKSH